MFGKDTVLSLILLVSEMQKNTKAKVEAYVLKKLVFVTNKYLAQEVFGKCAFRMQTVSGAGTYI